MLGRYLRSHDRRGDAADRPRPIGNVAKATLQDCMVSDTYIFTPQAINVARFSYNRIDAHPAGDERAVRTRTTASTCRTRTPLAAGLANIAVTGFFNARRRAAAVRRAASTRCRSSPTTSPGCRAALAEVRRRRPPGAHGDRLHQPAQRRLHVQRPGARTGNAAADFLLGLPVAVPPDDAEHSRRTAPAGCTPAYVQDEFRPVAAPDGERRPALRAAAAVRRRERRAERVPSRASSRRGSRPRRPGSSIPATRACRAAPTTTDKNNFAPRLGVVWDPTGDGRTSVRGAWGIFYDALAGQGDFFQNGVLAPPFTPLLEVNAPPAALTLRESAGGGQRRRHATSRPG